jgi:DUF438 domain-containing protein
MNEQFYLNLLNSMKYAVVVADLQHTIQFMNKAAIEQYKEGKALIGTSLLDCHSEESCKVIESVLEKLKTGKQEVLISDTPKNRIYMRAVRNPEGELIGYYERYEVPRWR